MPPEKKKEKKKGSRKASSSGSAEGPLVPRALPLASLREWIPKLVAMSHDELAVNLRKSDRTKPLVAACHDEPAATQRR